MARSARSGLQAASEDQFFERLANTGNQKLSAESLGRSIGWASNLMKRAVARLNPDEDLGWRREDSAHCREWDAKQGRG
jgi:hypothetical protein